MEGLVFSKVMMWKCPDVVIGLPEATETRPACL